MSKKNTYAAKKAKKSSPVVDRYYDSPVNTLDFMARTQERMEDLQ